MKAKKILLVPSALMCLALLSACGSSKTTRFTNGFESPEFEKYFKLPNNLKPVDFEYGMGVVYEEAMISATLAKSQKTTIQIAGTDSFFDSKIRQLEGGFMNASIGDRYIVAPKATPFASSSTIMYGQTTTTKYDDDLPVALHTENSYRSKIDAKGKSNTYDETDFSYLGYVVANKDKTYDAYTLTKGKSSILGKADVLTASPNSPIAYKEKFNFEPLKFNEAKFLFEDISNGYIMDGIKLPLSVMIGSGSGMVGQYCNLKGFLFDSEVDTTNSNLYGNVSSNIKFYSEGNKTIYATFNVIDQQGYVLSPFYRSSLEPTMSDLIPAYHKINLVAKFTLNSNRWYCDYAATNTKVFVLKDEKLNDYSTPRCLCSEYYCTDLNYNSCGKYGPVEQIADEYRSTKYGIAVDIYDGDGQTDEYQRYLYDGYYDTIIDHVGGIYDYTKTYEALGYTLEKHQHVFYGTFDFNSTETITVEDGETETKYEVTNIDFKLNLVDRFGDNDISLLDEVGKDDLKINTEYLEKNITDSINVVESGMTFEFIIYITLDNNDDSLETVDSITINYSSSMSAPAEQAKEI